MARYSHKLSIPSQTSQLARVRRYVASWAAEAGLSQKDADALQMAVDEACANAIEHGYGGKPDGTVDVEAKLKAEEVIVTVRHHGEPFNPELHQLTTLPNMREKRRQHGYGLHLMHKLVDDVRFKARGRTSEVRLTKRRNGSGNSA
jgi:serine/threonine-protein kinase RsbW